MQCDLSQFIFALSDTVDLVGIDEILHSKRVACMAYLCATEMGYSESHRQTLLRLGLLHDCGVSSTKERRQLINDFEWDDSMTHCTIGATRLAQLSRLQPYAQPVYYHHTPWAKLCMEKVEEDTAVDANLIFLLDRVDYIGQKIPGVSWMDKKEVIREQINRYRDQYFMDDLVDGFLIASANEAFWFALEPLMLMDFIAKRRSETATITISWEDLHTIADLFAQIVDAKSPFTAEHSTGVAALTRHLAQATGLSSKMQTKVEIAALLHDLGKLQVPDRVLSHAGPLYGSDLASMRHHSYVTYRILNNIGGLEDIATWAGNHHEALDGSGYPFRRSANDLDMPSRIIAVADIFQALAQNRPYREAKPLEVIINFLLSSAAKGRLDEEIVDLVCSQSALCHSLASSSQQIFSRPVQV